MEPAHSCHIQTVSCCFCRAQLFYFQMPHIFTGRPSTHKDRSVVFCYFFCFFFKEKKTLFSVCHRVLDWKMWRKWLELFGFFFPPETFSTDNSFHGRLASDLRLPLSLFNLGGGGGGVNGCFSSWAAVWRIDPRREHISSSWIKS